jgi:penicillin-binding protein 2
MIYDRPYLTLKSHAVRTYPYHESFAHLLGYTQAQPLVRFNQDQTATERAVSGLEKAFDLQLRGEPAITLVAKNAQQECLKTTLVKKEVPGKDVHLTLDASLQSLAYRIMSSYKAVGSLIVIDTKTGEILVAASYPSFDPALLNIKAKEYNQNDQQPFFFRAFQGLYPPASLVKPILGLAALEEGTITTETTLFDPGYYQLKGSKQRFHDWKKNGHGQVNLTQSIAQSCDTFFYSLGDQLGIDVMNHWLACFGFGMDFKLPIPNRTGILPSKRWKMKSLKEPWYHGESVLTAIGQGYFSATPLHLAYAAALLASKGQTPLPSLIKDQERVDRSHLFENIKHWDVIHHAMEQVIESRSGTAHRRLAGLKLPIAGKTGTAQVVSHQKSQSDHQNAFRDHSLFMAFAPKQAPKLALVVVVEHQQHATEIAGVFFSELVARNILSKDV